MSLMKSVAPGVEVERRAVCMVTDDSLKWLLRLSELVTVDTQLEKRFFMSLAVFHGEPFSNFIMGAMALASSSMMALARVASNTLPPMMQKASMKRRRKPSLLSRFLKRVTMRISCRYCVCLS